MAIIALLHTALIATLPATSPGASPAARLRARLSEEAGFSTAELLGNAALGVAALVAIWAGMEALGVEVMTWIRGQLIS